MNTRGLLCTLAAVAFGVLAFGNAQALAAAPEAPVTGPVSGVTATSATLGGTLNPGASAKTGWYFFYSTEISCLVGQGATGQEPEVEGQALAEHVEVTGLQPSMTYRFCMVATNEAGEATPSANETSFTTLAAPPAVEGETTSSVNSTVATLEGQVNPNNQVTSCEIQYGTTTSYGTNAPCEPPSLEGFGDQRAALLVTGLTPGATYHFRIVAENAGKEKEEGADQSFTTVPTPNTDPMSAITPTTATFNGHLTLDPVDTQYFFYYKVGTECAGESQTAQEDAGSGAGTLASPSAAVTGLRPATQYAVCMVTTNAFGSEQAAPVTFTTLPTAPKVEGESFEDSGEQVLLNAHIIPNGGNTTYQFEYGETSSYGSSIPVSAGNIGSGNESVAVPAAEPAGLKTSTTYHYRVLATNQYGTTDGPDQTFLTPPVLGASSVPGPTGLPNGRVYEEVSPSYKNGNFYDLLSNITFGLASADGNAVVYPMSGPVGTAYVGIFNEYVSRRTPGSGWRTESATPRPLSNELSPFTGPLAIVPSSDFSRFLFTALLRYVAEATQGYNEAGGKSSVNIYLSGNPAVEPAWLGRPQIDKPQPALGEVPFNDFLVAGAASNLDTVYFTYKGTLLPEDATRTEGSWGFYEWNDGKLVSADVLPNGTESPSGALPASIANEPNLGSLFAAEAQAQALHNEVSEDGSRAFFVSAEGPSDPRELYVREPSPDGHKISILVSRSELPGHEGEPAPNGGSFAYAAPDGSQAFFASTDRLTQNAPENAESKVYDFDVDKDTLTYLPGVSSAIATVSQDGSEMLFEDASQLKLWRNAPGGGSVTPIAEGGGVTAAHISADGSVVVFRTAAPIPGGFNNGSGNEVYRYEVDTHDLVCVSCLPVGSAPSGEARMSYNNYEIGIKQNGTDSDPLTTIETRGMSSDGRQIFFDTTSALVPQDTNGQRDVYEWDDGAIYLVSSGSSPDESQILDSSESGGDVFFATSSGLVPGDTDEAYDVYDARIPRPGDNPPPQAVPCQGSVCQGPPSVPDLLGAPASASFSGAGNVTPTAEAKPRSKPKAKQLTRGQKLAKALKSCKREKNKQKRVACKRQASRSFGSKQKAKKSAKGGK